MLSVTLGAGCGMAEREGGFQLGLPDCLPAKPESIKDQGVPVAYLQRLGTGKLDFSNVMGGQSQPVWVV